MDLEESIKTIFNTINNIEGVVEKINKKIINVKQVIQKFENNKNLSLDQTNSYLTFQINLLTNEKNYYNSIKNIILDKLYSEVLEIYNYVTMILTSIENLEIEHQEDKHNINKKIVIYKKEDIIDCSHMLMLINITINNINLIKSFVDLFEDYIQKTFKQASEDNIHCNNFNSTLENKKNHIFLEYKKYNTQLEELIKYFVDCTEYIENQEIINFLIEKKS